MVITAKRKLFQWWRSFQNYKNRDIFLFWIVLIGVCLFFLQLLSCVTIFIVHTLVWTSGACVPCGTSDQARSVSCQLLLFGWLALHSLVNANRIRYALAFTVSLCWAVSVALLSWPVRPSLVNAATLRCKAAWVAFGATSTQSGCALILILRHIIVVRKRSGRMIQVDSPMAGHRVTGGRAAVERGVTLPSRNRPRHFRPQWILSVIRRAPSATCPSDSVTACSIGHWTERKHPP